MMPSVFDFGGVGRSYMIAVNILFWLGAALTVVVLVFTILAVHKGKKLIDAFAGVEFGRSARGLLIGRDT